MGDRRLGVRDGELVFVARRRLLPVARLHLRSAGAVLRRRGLEVVLPWDGYGETVPAGWRLGRIGDSSVHVDVGPALLDGGPWPWARRVSAVDDVEASWAHTAVVVDVPLTDPWDGPTRALLTAVRQHPPARAGLDDPARVARLVDDVRSDRGHGRGRVEGTAGSRRWLISSGLEVAGEAPAWWGGRPFPWSPRLDLDHLADRVLAHTPELTAADRTEVVAQLARELDAPPWPFAALVD